MIKRDRAKQVMVESVFITDVGVAGVMVVGDVHGPCTPFTYAEAYAGLRGAGSFATQEVLTPQNSRLNYNNRLDENVRDLNIIGESRETFRPDIQEPYER